MKRRLGRIAKAFFALALGTAAATRAQSPTFTLLYTFTGQPDGESPQAPLVMDGSGNLYGTTGYGGSSNGCPFGCGIVFKLDTSRNEMVLHSFTGGSDGARPFAGLIRDAVGNLYGTTEGTPSPSLGTVFKVDTSGNETPLYSFTGFPSDGAIPFGGLIMDAAGNLYGTTSVGGSSNSVEHGFPGLGTVFELDSAGNETVLHSFTGSPNDGDYPGAGLIMDAAGNLYGTTEGGGAFGQGVVFKLDPAHNETVLHSFTGADGAAPSASLIVDAAGNLYGTAFRGGAFGTCPSGCGTVFKLDPSGNITVLHTFTGGIDGANPAGALIMDAAGNLYGTTSDNDNFIAGLVVGTVFKLDRAYNETVLYSFTGGNDGGGPRGALIMDNAGNLYGTTSVGGGLSAFGTVFKLTVQTPAPTITSISPTGAIAGGASFTLTVNGTNFVSGSTVNFNGSGVATTFVSSTQLVAAIPASDITAVGTFNITVTNPGGTTSNAVSVTVVTPQQATQAIVSAVNAMFSQGVLNEGQNNSVVKQLQQAINLMNAGKNAGAIANLDSFISEVNDLLSSGVLSASQAASLVSAAQSVIAAI